ncbi:MAG: flavodoxin family protein [Desulfobacterales bacterium]|jgi:multimeric flavodoxin WrbA
MSYILAVYGSPRRKGNTATLLQQAVQGAREAGAEVEEIVLRDLKMSPCLEIYGCKQDGRCVIQDDYQKLHDKLLRMDGIMLASPIFFYTVSAFTKIFMDRCNVHWVKKYWIDQAVMGKWENRRKGLFIAAGATQGRKLFAGVELSVRYFFDAIDTQLWRSLCFRGLDFQGDVLKHPAYLEEAHAAGRGLALALAADVVNAAQTAPPAAGGA